MFDSDNTVTERYGNLPKYEGLDGKIATFRQYARRVWRCAQTLMGANCSDKETVIFEESWKVARMGNMMKYED